MKKILVIEDNKEVRENIAEILQLSDYESITAENGKIGVEKALKEIPDLILCDVMMPELDGFGVLRILSNNVKTMDIPFIFLTAKTEKEDFRKGMGLGADDYITKPFDDVDLFNAIEIRLKKSERLKQPFERTSDGLTSFFNEARANKELEKLSRDREVRKFRKKEIIYEEGEYPKFLYFIISGKVKIYKTNELGKEYIIDIHTGGDFVGYLPLIKEHKHTDSAAALEDSEICLILKDDFYSLIFNNRDFSAKFIRMLAQEVTEIEDQLINLAYNSVRRKVASALISLHRKYERDGKSHISILREDLASLVGTAKETVIRTLSDFKDEGLIAIEDNEIIVLNEEKLIGLPN
jgi:CRP-like cAMP-binding protein/ActR/RegA family two-component response regulator